MRRKLQYHSCKRWKQLNSWFFQSGWLQKLRTSIVLVDYSIKIVFSLGIILKIYTNSGPLLLKSWQVTIRGAFFVLEWNLLDNLKAHKHFYWGILYLKSSTDDLTETELRVWPPVVETWIRNSKNSKEPTKIDASSHKPKQSS